jgi:hypothetical protein
MIKRTVLFICLLVIVTAVVGSALDIKEGRIKLVLHENTGRFSAYYLTDLSKGIYKPFLLTDDPRTTYLSVVLADKVYQMGESSGFKQTIESTSNGAKFVWRSSFAEVSEEFSFLRSPSSPVADGFKITVTIKNISERRYRTRARYLFDTYLGEETNTHFSTETIDRVSGETSFTRFAMPKYVLSPGGEEKENDFRGYQIMLKGEGIDTPERVVLANWKRLNDTVYDYEVKTASNFNLLPYSVNDSAICLYFGEETLERNQSRELVLAMGNYTEDGFSTDSEGVKSDIEAVFDKTLKSSEEIADTDLSVQTDLLTVTDLIDKIDQGLDDRIDISENEIELMNQVIEELKKRKIRYGSE